VRKKWRAASPQQELHRAPRLAWAGEDCAEY
jgi:hypothetical protein